MRILLWYRNDLRLHDHEPLAHALALQAQIIPVYCFDPRQFGKTAFGFPKTGSFRATFLAESVADLRKAWQIRGSNLVIRRGLPEVILPDLAKALQADAVYWQAEVSTEEVHVEQALVQTLSTLGIPHQAFDGSTLVHPDDLPFSIADLPDVFTHFRKQVERHWQIRPVFPTPAALPRLPLGLDLGEAPTLAELGHQTLPLDPRGVLDFRGGETVGLARLQTYVWERDLIRTYKTTRNGLLGADYSSKFSPWLAVGAISPRFIYHTIQDYEAERGRNDSTYWLVFELLWRDYFRFICDRYSNRVFFSSGIQGIPIPWAQDWDLFQTWCRGKTGFPFVDANMRELAATGFMSNRGRQNVASFLTKNLGLDWRLGAEWFESLLIDYDVYSNYGNWNYLAGVGNDARGFRYFNILKQAQDYDPQGQYVKHWLPELGLVPAPIVQTPWQLTASEQKGWQIQLGIDYPHPVVDLAQSVAINQARYNAALEQAQH